jgi:hypothetical protein
MSSLLDELLQIERSLWTNDPDIYERAHDSDAVLIFPEVGRISIPAAVDAIRKENREGRHWADVKFENTAARPIATDCVLLTYLVTARWNYETAPSKALCSTIYVGARTSQSRTASANRTVDLVRRFSVVHVTLHSKYFA